MSLRLLTTFTAGLALGVTLGAGGALLLTLADSEPSTAVTAGNRVDRPPASAVSGQQQVPPPVSGRWELIRHKDPISDSIIIVLAGASNNPAAREHLAFRCYQGVKDKAAVFDQAGVLFDYPAIRADSSQTITLRADDKPPLYVFAKRSTDYFLQMSEVISAAQGLRAVRQAQDRIAVRATTESDRIQLTSRSVDLVIPVHGLAEPLREFLEACPTAESSSR